MFVKVEEPDTVNAPVMIVFVFILNPSTGEIEAVALPDAICDRFSPTIPDAGMLVNPAPSPVKLPVKLPVL